MLKVDIDPNSGFCAGVIRAISKAEDSLSKEGGKIYSLGAIVHNDAELERLSIKGLVTIDKEDLDEIYDAGGERLLIRAHGEPPATYDTARAKGFRTPEEHQGDLAEDTSAGQWRTGADIRKERPR